MVQPWSPQSPSTQLQAPIVSVMQNDSSPVSIQNGNANVSIALAIRAARATMYAYGTGGVVGMGKECLCNAGFFGRWCRFTVFPSVVDTDAVSCVGVQNSWTQQLAWASQYQMCVCPENNGALADVFVAPHYYYAVPQLYSATDGGLNYYASGNSNLESLYPMIAQNAEGGYFNYTQFWPDPPTPEDAFPFSILSALNVSPTTTCGALACVTTSLAQNANYSSYFWSDQLAAWPAGFRVWTETSPDDDYLRDPAGYYAPAMTFSNFRRQSFKATQYQASTTPELAEFLQGTPTMPSSSLQVAGSVVELNACVCTVFRGCYSQPQAYALGQACNASQSDSFVWSLYGPGCMYDPRDSDKCGPQFCGGPGVGVCQPPPPSNGGTTTYPAGFNTGPLASPWSWGDSTTNSTTYASSTNATAKATLFSQWNANPWEYSRPHAQCACNPESGYSGVLCQDTCYTIGAQAQPTCNGRGTCCGPQGCGLPTGTREDYLYSTQPYGLNFSLFGLAALPPQATGSYVCNCNSTEFAGPGCEMPAFLKSGGTLLASIEVMSPASPIWTQQPSLDTNFLPAAFMFEWCRLGTPYVDGAPSALPLSMETSWAANMIGNSVPEAPWVQANPLTPTCPEGGTKCYSSAYSFLPSLNYSDYTYQCEYPAVMLNPEGTNDLSNVWPASPRPDDAFVSAYDWPLMRGTMYSQPAQMNAKILAAASTFPNGYPSSAIVAQAIQSPLFRFANGSTTLLNTPQGGLQVPPMQWTTTYPLVWAQKMYNATMNPSGLPNAAPCMNVVFNKPVTDCVTYQVTSDHGPACPFPLVPNAADPKRFPCVWPVSCWATNNPTSKNPTFPYQNALQNMCRVEVRWYAMMVSCFRIPASDVKNCGTTSDLPCQWLCRPSYDVYKNKARFSVYLTGADIPSSHANMENRIVK
jgi:hypothetical protein